MAELNLKESFVVDEEGRRVGVLLSISAYNELMNHLRELETFRAANDISTVEEMINQESRNQSEVQPVSFRPRRGPGGMIVI